MGDYRAFFMKVQNLIRAAMFFVLFGLVFNYFSAVFSPRWVGINDNLSRTATFYTQPRNTIDVLFLGASSFRSGISPLVIWEKFGFTSYSRATSPQAPAVTYYYLRESLKYQHPKVVVLDGVSLFDYYKVDSREGTLRVTIDPMKLSMEKIQLIFDIVSKSNKQTFIDYLFPLLRYHARWKDLQQGDFEFYKKDIYDHFRGQYLNYQVSRFRIPKNYMQPTGETAKFDKTALDYYEKIFNLCKENDIQVVFLTLPRLNDKWDYSKYLAVKQLAEKHNYPFINYSLPEETGDLEFDRLKDFSDPGHLNVYGAQKFSELFGAFLQEKFALPDTRSTLAEKDDPKYGLWNADLQYYKNQLEQEKLKAAAKK
jgi:hypothetical protein